MATDSADYCMLINEWAWSKSQVYLLWPEVDMGAVLDSELRQKWEIRYVKCMCRLKVA